MKGVRAVLVCLAVLAGCAPARCAERSRAGVRERPVWTTNQTGIQESVLGTGTRITARLFTDRCEGRWHDIRLTARSDDTERYALRRIHVWSVC